VYVEITMKLALPIIIILASVFTSCESKMAGDSIDKGDIDSAIITKHNSSSIADTSKMLSESSIEKFANKWNTSPSSGPYKCIPKYILTIYFNDNTRKKFATCGQNVKEQNDWCINFMDSTFFDNLWNTQNISK
jgi:hypothetical protein